MKYLILAGVAILLSACETITEVPVTADGGVAWQTHQASVSKLKHWRIEGRLAINNGDEAWNLNLLWQQNGDQYDMELSGLFGAGKVQLSGNANGVKLLDSDQREHLATSAEELLYVKTGVIMPVTDLRYWVLGLPSPHASAQSAYDPNGRLASLQQADWRVAFRRYTQVNQYPLPDKLFITRQDKTIDVRLVVDNWQLNTQQAANNE